MKISEMIIAFSGDYISMGNTIEEKHSYLNAACTAWNISILPKHERKKEISNYINEYKRLNPHVSDQSNLRHDIEKLIKQKIRMFPDVKKRIYNAEIIKNGDEYSIFAATVRTE
jgi:hypothetical protein